MYKKRLKTWGYTKQVKSDVKEKILAKILHDEPVTDEMVTMRPDKLWRYARSRIKSGTLGSEELSKITKRYAATPIAVAEVISVPSSPALPDQFAQFDVFLRAMQSVILRERSEYLSGYQIAPDTIHRALSNGMALWHQNDFTAARISFGQAAHKTMEDLRQPIVSVSRIAYCISSILWGSEHSPVFQKFAEFMVNAALETLGAESPMTIVLKYIRHEQSVDVQVRIWECGLSDYKVSEDNLVHWWNMSQRRWQWCWRSGKLDLAARYCNQAMIEARQINQLSVEMEVDAQHDLDMIVLQVQSEASLQINH
jgi:hypothetical protein